MKPEPNTCVACKFEAEWGTQEVPHPVDERIHTCKSFPVTDPPEPPSPLCDKA